MKLKLHERANGWLHFNQLGKNSVSMADPLCPKLQWALGAAFSTNVLMTSEDGRRLAAAAETYEDLLVRDTEEEAIAKLRAARQVLARERLARSRLRKRGAK